MNETLEIQKYKAAALADKIDKLNRKAAKIGCPTMTLTIGEDIVRNWTDEFGCRQIQVTVEATLDYEIPIIDGWKLISTFDIYAAANAGEEYIPVVTTSTVPGETLPPGYLIKTEIHCDHCGHNRRRTHSMLMLHIETGEYKEVGSTCVKDFFGHDPVAFMRWASWSFEALINEIPEDKDEFAKGISFAGLKETLIYTSATIRKFGWMSKGKAFEQGKDWNTADEVQNQMFNAKYLNASERVEIEDRDIALAEATIKYFSELSDISNDYMANCHKMTVLGYVPSKHMGLTVSMVPTAKRAIAQAKEAAADTSEFVGTIGDKLAGIEAEVVFSTELASDYGPKILYIFKGTDGNTYKTFYTGSKWEAYEGDKVTLNGTVKKHDVYNGKKATLLTRCFAKVTADGSPEAVEANAPHSTDEFEVALAA
jgi:hypothetical protein